MEQLKSEAFSSMFNIPPSYLEYKPMDFNETIDRLHEILNQGKVTQEVANDGGQPAAVTAIDHKNNGCQLMDVNAKRRRRNPKTSKEVAERRELRKIRNREAAARCSERKQAYVECLEIELEKLQKKNANLKMLLLFAESSIGVDTTRKQLRRTASGLM